MTVLVVGGTQFFGRKFVDLMLERDVPVTVLTRGKTSLPWAGDAVEHIAADRNDVPRLHERLTGRSYDVVFDNVAMNDDHVRDLLNAVQTGHYMLMSSGAVYHRDSHVAAMEYVSDAGGEKLPDWTDAMRPLRERSVPANPHWLMREAGGEEQKYRRGKLSAECAAVRTCEDLGIPFTIFRPPQVEGPWDPTGRTEFFARRVADEAGILLPHSGRGRVFQKVFRDDLARAIAAAMGNSRAMDRTYNVAQEEVLSLERYLCVIADCLGVNPPTLLDCDGDGFAHAVGTEYRIPLPRPKILDLRRAQRDLGFRSSPYLQWMSRTLEWIFSHEPSEEYRRLRREEVKWISATK